MLIKMFNKLFVFLAAVLCFAHGSYGESHKPQYKPKEFLTSRIVGGVEAPEAYGKHMAALVYGYRWAYLVCGGSIITKRHILTAAHCIQYYISWNRLELLPTFRATVGSKSWSAGTQVLYFSKYVLHDKWNEYTIKNDIGVLTTTQDIQTSDTVAIIPINWDWVDADVTSYVTGWGQLGEYYRGPEKLQLLYVKTITYQKCKKAVLDAAEVLGPAPPIQDDVEICTLHSPGHGMCNGDSGSALVQKDTQEQIGIVSWGFPCAHGVPDVFVRMSSFKDWLLDYVKDHLP